MIGEPCTISDDPCTISGDPCTMSGYPFTMSGDPCTMSGDPCTISGDLNNSTVNCLFDLVIFQIISYRPNSSLSALFAKSYRVLVQWENGNNFL